MTNNTELTKGDRFTWHGEIYTIAHVRIIDSRARITTTNGRVIITSDPIETL